MKKILAILLIITISCNIYAQQDDITVTNLAVRPSTPQICATAEVEVVIRVLGALDGYDNSMHESSVKILLPGFYYTQEPADGVNYETNFDNTQITVTSTDGIVYWEPPIIVGDHEVKLTFKDNAVIPFGTDIYFTITNMEIDDAQSDWSNTVEATIEHVARDYDLSNDLKSVPTATQACCTAAPTLTGTSLPTYIGISTLDRNTDSNWVTASEGAFLRLESETLGFVPTRLTSTERDELNAEEGMMIFNETTQCLEYYNGTTWVCGKNKCNP